MNLPTMNLLKTLLPGSHATVLLLTLLLALPAAVQAKDGNWLLVDTASRELLVYQDDVEIATFRNFAIGRGGASLHRSRGDKTTPLGEFRIGWINRESKFHIFLGFDFPSYQYASRAYAAGRLPLEDYLNVASAVRNRQLPPQTTPLGGHLGIHGLGNADPWLHRMADWTQGCIAMTNSEIEQLMNLVSIGTRVVVR